MAWRVELSQGAVDDLRAQFRHLRDSHVGFGYAPDEAAQMAQRRVRSVAATAGKLANMPGIGTKHPEIRDRLRHVTLDRAIYWFEVDEASETVRVLAIFTPGQNHFRHILARLGGAGEGG